MSRNRHVALLSSADRIGREWNHDFRDSVSEARDAPVWIWRLRWRAYLACGIEDLNPGEELIWRDVGWII